MRIISPRCGICMLIKDKEIVSNPPDNLPTFSLAICGKYSSICFNASDLLGTEGPSSLNDKFLPSKENK